LAGCFAIGNVSALLIAINPYTGLFRTKAPQNEWHMRALFSHKSDIISRRVGAIWNRQPFSNGRARSPASYAAASPIFFFSKLSFFLVANATIVGARGMAHLSFWFAYSALFSQTFSSRNFAHAFLVIPCDRPAFGLTSLGYNVVGHRLPSVAPARRPTENLPESRLRVLVCFRRGYARHGLI
jgi:hypothetical protein